MEIHDLEEQLSALSTLYDPVRRSLYLYVASSESEVGRDEAAEAVDISRSLAAFHLDKLAGEGLLEVSFRRLTGRGGPGAGRPSKLYKRSTKSFEIVFPSRRYGLAARIFAAALQGVHGKRGSVEQAARDFGLRLGSEARALAGPRQGRTRVMDSLANKLAFQGFEPRRTAPGEIRLGNCPFEGLVADYPTLVCGMNHAFMEGVVEGVGIPGLSAYLEPAPARCCVTFRLGK